MTEFKQVGQHKRAASFWSRIRFVTPGTAACPATATVGREGFSVIEVSTVMNPSTPRVTSICE